ncbi:lipopolysaccharide heptosyltransferase I [Campylobacter troglodytis]|uniref:lipopolysaccharide heptosyltransferase I n=1 Tax=Campylobacter troglodytis TaxID=654363 RepID=UPI00115B1628|nr:lipopolysaccharide heptosyltransferase I [Campylobacter troglodytis]TQR56581.1 lipopolysaccharide heptosyltransferase I [Campylobacter troglodytis]
MKIALIRLSALGDIIQSSIVLQFIKKKQPEAEIDWFVDERFKGILEAHPLINTLYALPLKDKKILSSLKMLLSAKKKEYDLVIDLQGLLKSALIARILSSNAYGFDRKSLKEVMASFFYKHKAFVPYKENIILRNIYLLGFVLDCFFDKAEILTKKPCFEADESLQKKLLKKLKLAKCNVLIHTGSSTANKNYPKERLSILSQMILSSYEETKIWLCWGNEEERSFCEFILKDSAREGIFILPKLSLQELSAFTALCDLIIGNDSGPTHLAFAMNKPSITIFGATPSYRNAYQTPINKIIDSGKFISDPKHIDKNDFCIQSIDERQIFDHVKALLGS